MANEKYGTVICLSGFYLIGMSVLKYLYVLEWKEFVIGLTQFVGWLVAIIIVSIQVEKTRENNQIDKTEEFRKKLRIDAFREVNETIKECSETLYDISSRYSTKLTYLTFSYITKPEPGKFNKADIYNHMSIMVFHDYFDSDDIPVSLTNPDRWSNFQSRCQKIADDANQIVGYLHDYRIHSMNQLMGDIFEKLYKPRIVNSNRLSLIDVATKEKVDAEEKRRLAEEEIEIS